MSEQSGPLCPSGAHFVGMVKFKTVERALLVGLVEQGACLQVCMANLSPLVGVSGLGRYAVKVAGAQMIFTPAHQV